MWKKKRKIDPSIGKPRYREKEEQEKRRKRRRWMWTKRAMCKRRQ